MHKKIPLILVLIIVLQLCNIFFNDQLISQTIQVFYIANEGFLISSKTKAIFVDALMKNPWGYDNTLEEIFGRMMGSRKPFQKIDLLTFSHAHKDHFHQAMAVHFMLKHPETILLGASEVCDSLKKVAGTDFAQIESRIKCIIGSIGSKLVETVHGIEIKILGMNRAGFGEKNYLTLGYLFKLDGMKVLYLGDLNAETNEEYFKAFHLQNEGIDLLFADASFLCSYIGHQIVTNYIRPNSIVMMHLMKDQVELYFQRYKTIYPNLKIFREPLEMQEFNFERKQEIHKITKERLEKHVRILSEKFVPRDYLHFDNLNRAADYIRQEFERAGGIVSEQPYEVAGQVYRNIIARFGNEGGERIVIGAHYDAYKNAPGADDNASGVAGIIELAYLFGSMNMSLSKSIELVAYGTEEPPNFGKGKMGSDFHARWLKEQGVQVPLMISLDQIGLFFDDEGSQRFPLPEMKNQLPATAGNFILVVSSNNYQTEAKGLEEAMKQSTNVPVYSLAASPDSIPWVAISDARSYWEYGFPAVLVTDTAPFRGNSRHNENDTAETLDFKRMRAVVISISSAIIGFAK